MRFLRRGSGENEEFRCTKCLKWKHRGDFRKSNLRQIGITSACKTCLTAADTRRRAANGGEINRKRREAYALEVEETKRAAEVESRQGSYGAIRIDPERVRPFVIRLMELAPDKEFMYKAHNRPNVLTPLSGYSWASARTGVDPSTLSRLMKGTYEYQVSLEIAEKIAFEVDMEEELWALLPFPGRDDWGLRGERFCSRCGTFHRKHHAKGLCRKCYSNSSYHLARGHSIRPPKDERWSTWYDSCSVCDTSDSHGTNRHMSKGVCVRCYHRLFRRCGGAAEMWIYIARMIEAGKRDELLRQH